MMFEWSPTTGLAQKQGLKTFVCTCLKEMSSNTLKGYHGMSRLEMGWNYQSWILFSQQEYENEG